MTGLAAAAVCSQPASCSRGQERGGQEQQREEDQTCSHQHRGEHHGGPGDRERQQPAQVAGLQVGDEQLPGYGPGDRGVQDDDRQDERQEVGADELLDAGGGTEGTGVDGEDEGGDDQVDVRRGVLDLTPDQPRI